MITTRVPREIRNSTEGGHHVKNRPSDDNAVVNVQKEDQNHGSNANALEQRAQLCHQSHATRTQVLANGDFLEENGDSAKGHGNEINDEKSACK